MRKGHLRAYRPARRLVLGLGMALALAVALIEQRPNNHHQIAMTVLKDLHDLIY
jgi:hypothetical protein